MTESEIYAAGIFLAMLKRAEPFQAEYHQEAIATAMQALAAVERVQAFCDRMQVEAEDGSRADADTVWPSDVLAVLRGEEPSV